MICRNCGKEFEGKFCPDCGTCVEEQTVDIIIAEEKQELAESPNYGRESAVGGFNYKELNINNCFEQKNVKESKINLSNAGRIISKIYRYILASGMLFIGFVALLCLTSPTVTESFMGMKNNLCSGFVAIGNGANCDVPSSVVGASRMLLIISLCALAYGGWQLYLAIKKPYSTIKKYQYWVIDGIISLTLIILGGVVSSASKEGMNGQVGSGFAMCITMGVFGLIFFAARILYEFKVFKWADTGLTEEQIAKSLEKKPKKERKQKDKEQEMQVKNTKTQSYITHEVQTAKKRKRALLTLDLIITVAPIVFVVALLIYIFFPEFIPTSQIRNSNNAPLSLGGVPAYFWISVLLFGLLMCICIFIRCLYEPIVYKCVNPYPKKKLNVKAKIIIPLVIAIALTAIIVPSVVVSNNIFRIGKVDCVHISTSNDNASNRSEVFRILGQPNESSEYKYEYYSDNYIKASDEIEKALNKFDLDKADKLLEKLENLTYKYIRVDFDGDGKAISVLLDTKRCDGKSDVKKSVKSYGVLSTTKYTNAGSAYSDMAFSNNDDQWYDNQWDDEQSYDDDKIIGLEIAFWIKYKDGSIYKSRIKIGSENIYEWRDEFGNMFVYEHNDMRLA